MRFAGVTAAGYEFVLERVPPAEFLAVFDRALYLRELGWDVELLEAEDGSHFVFLGCFYLEEPGVMAS